MDSRSNVSPESLAVLLGVIIACWLDVDAITRVLLIGSVLLIMIVEILNSAIEAVVDRIGSEYHELSGRAKDMGSAAVLLSIFVALMTGASCYGHIFDKGSKFYKSLVFAPFVVPKSPLTVYTHSMTVYTPRGGMKALTANKRCLISSGITSARQVCHRRVRKSRSVWGSVPQTRRKNILKRWRAKGCLKSFLAHREVSVCYRKKRTDYRLSGVSRRVNRFWRSSILKAITGRSFTVQTQRRFPAARERYVDERHRYYGWGFAGGT